MAEDVGTKIGSGTVKLPGIGPVKKVYVYVGVGVVGVLAAYLMWRRQQDAGVEYTDAEMDDGLTTAEGSDVYQGANAGGAPSAAQDVEEMPKTNTEWTRAVTEYFNWLEPGYVSSVLGKYLGRVALSREEADFVRQAWAAMGKPPEGPSNFTLTNDSSSPGTGTNPSVPSGLKVGTVTAGSVALDWTDTPDTTGYQVFRNGALVGSPVGSLFTDSGLASGTSYSYTVKAVNNGKVSAASSAVTAKTKAAGPVTVAAPVVTGLRLASATTTSLTFTWSWGSVKPDYILAYVNNEPREDVKGAPTSYTVRGLKKGTQYKFQVRGIKGSTTGSSAGTTGTTRK